MIVLVNKKIELIFYSSNYESPKMREIFARTDEWSRCGAFTCPHDLKDLERCRICNVIIYDRPLDSLKELPFSQLMIASPRSRVPSESELPDLLKRLKGENALIDLDSRTKFRRQKDYIQAQLSQVSTPTTGGPSGQSTKPHVVTFEENISEDRAILFPKIDVPVRQQTFESNSMTRLNSIATSQATDSNDALVLVSGDALGTTRLKVYLSPFDGDFVELVVDSAVTVAQTINAIIDHKKLDMTCFWTLRWVEDDDGRPDFDLPPVDSDQTIANLNASELCMCSPDDERSSDGSSI